MEGARPAAARVSRGARGARPRGLVSALPTAGRRRVPRRPARTGLPGQPAPNSCQMPRGQRACACVIRSVLNFYNIPTTYIVVIVAISGGGGYSEMPILDERHFNTLRLPQGKVTPHCIGSISWDENPADRLQYTRIPREMPDLCIPSLARPILSAMTGVVCSSVPPEADSAHFLPCERPLAPSTALPHLQICHVSTETTPLTNRFVLHNEGALGWPQRTAVQRARS